MSEVMKEITIDDMYESTVRYFDAFTARDLEVLEELYSDSIYLRDWEGTCVGKADVLGANSDLFNNVKAIVCRICALHCDEDSLTVVAEIEIMIADSEPFLVADVIEFNTHGEIKAIRAYKG